MSSNNLQPRGTLTSLLEIPIEVAHIPGASTQIVGFVTTSNNDQAVNASRKETNNYIINSVRSHIEKSLPVYMSTPHWTVIDAIPPSHPITKLMPANFVSLVTFTYFLIARRAESSLTLSRTTLFTPPLKNNLNSCGKRLDLFRVIAF